MARLLVVDDEDSANFMIRQIFRKEIKLGEYELLYAANGEQALEQLSSQSVDVVLSDINMPVMDGLTLLVEIYKRRINTRVIMISAYNDMPRIRHSMNYGSFDYITKPVDASDLRGTVKKLLEFIAERATP